MHSWVKVHINKDNMNGMTCEKGQMVRNGLGMQLSTCKNRRYFMLLLSNIRVAHFFRHVAY